MAKVCFLLAVLCGLASMNVSSAEPSTMYGAAPAAKYPAPAPAPAAYPAPAPAPPKYETPAPPKYEAPTTAKYEEKKEEYPVKMEYKTEEKPQYPPMKMEYGGKKYRRSTIEDEEEDDEEQSDPFRPLMYGKQVAAIRDAVIEKILSENDPGILKNILRGGAKVVRSFLGLRDRDNDPARFSRYLGRVGSDFAGSVLGELFGDEQASRRMGLSRKQSKYMRDAIMFEAENDPRFGTSFRNAFARNSAGAVGSYIGSKIRGGDPARGKKFPAGSVAGRLAAGVLKGYLRNDEDDLTMEDFEDLMMDAMPTKKRWML